MSSRAGTVAREEVAVPQVQEGLAGLVARAVYRALCSARETPAEAAAEAMADKDRAEVAAVEDRPSPSTRSASARRTTAIQSRRATRSVEGPRDREGRAVSLT